MRAKVSTRKRLIAIIIASVILLALLIFIIVKMSALTKDILNNDNITGSVDCVAVKTFDDDISKTISLFAPDIIISKEIAGEIEKNKSEFCIVNLRYNFINNTGKDISDFSMEISPVENSKIKLYAYSPLKLEDKSDNIFIFSQSIVMKKSHLDSKYFTDELPLNFEANLRYVFSYKMAGQTGEKALKFTTVKREEEIDEYELLFENEEKSDASDGDE
ncbi:MAG: hypothetical protein IJN40_04245 [Clostridia bacterium]|nr:hypothetical protein [Clostridia bacterium]